MSIPQTLVRSSLLHNDYTMKSPGYSITYKVKRRTDYVRKDGRSAIFFQCFINGEIVRIAPEGLYASPKEWDQVKERYRGRSQRATDANLIIEDYASRIHDISVQVRLGKININPKNFVEQVLNYSMRTDFLAYWKWKITQRIKELSPETLRHHRSVFNKFKEFAGPSCTFPTIDDDFIYKWCYWLRTEQGNKAESSIHAKTKCLKTYLNLALQDGYVFKMPEKSLRGKSFKSKVAHLSRKELKKAIELYQKEYLPLQYQQTLQVFLFSCFTGLRYGDVSRITRDNIIGKYLVFVPEKTKRSGKQAKIPLTRAALNIINKEGPLFDRVITNQAINENLKVIARYIGTPIKLHFHVARHTFATLFLELGGDVTVLQQLLQHTNITQTMGYVHVVQRQSEDQMDNFDKWLD